MKVLSVSFILFVALQITPFNVCSQQATTKKINVTVTDAKTGKPMREAEVTFIESLNIGGHNVDGVRKTLITDAEGKVTFEIPAKEDLLYGDLKVNDGKFISEHEKRTIPITLKAGEDVYNVTVSLKSDYKLISVAVVDEETKKPIPNAKVTLINAAINGQDLTAYTDASGTAALEVALIANTLNIKASVTKAGYSSFNTTIGLTYKIQQYSVTASLKNDKSTRTLTVTVVSEKNNDPLPEATIYAGAHTAQTNQAGVAEVVFKNSVNTTVRVTHAKYKTASKPLNINFSAEHQDYSLDFALIPLLQPRDLHIYVKEEYEPGKTRPAELIKITGIFGNSKGYIQGKWQFIHRNRAITAQEIVTDASGKIVVEHTEELGRVINLTAHATKPDNESDTKSFTVGGGNWRYFPPGHDRVDLLLKYKPKGLALTVQVLDEKTNDPVKGASVAVKNNSGTSFSAAKTNSAAGEHTFNISKTKVGSYLRVIAKAANYEEKWSDVTGDLLESGERVFTIYLKPKAVTENVKKYGPFSVDLFGWKSTGLRLKKGGGYSTEATGKITYNDAYGTPVNMYPDGHGPWRFFVLKAKIGDKQQSLGTNGGGYVEEDGVLELGAPRVSQFIEGDGKGATGNWQVYVFTKDAVEEKKPVTKSNTTSDSIKAHQHLEFLKKLRRGERPGGRNIEELKQEVKYIVSKYKMDNINPHYLEWGLSNISNYHSAASLGNLTPKLNEDYQEFLGSVILALEDKIDATITPGFIRRWDRETSVTNEKRYPAFTDKNPGSGKQLRIDKLTFTVGEKFNVQFLNLPGNAKDWISIAKAGDPENQYIQWFHTDGKKEGIFSFTGLPAGTYEARLFYNNSFKIEERVEFNVVANPEGDFIIKTFKTVFNENEPIKVMFSNSQGVAADWIAIADAGSADTKYGQWFRRGALASGEMNFAGLNAGDYEIRYYLNNGYEVKKKIPVKVVKP